MAALIRPEIIWYSMKDFDKEEGYPVLVTDGAQVTIALWKKVMRQKYEIDMGVFPEMEFVREYWIIGYGEKGQALFLEKSFTVTAWSPLPRAPGGKAEIVPMGSGFATGGKGARGLIL